MDGKIDGKWVQVFYNSRVDEVSKSIGKVLSRDPIWVILMTKGGNIIHIPISKIIRIQEGVK